MKTYKGKITGLKANQILVFGSNTQGRHGAGSALWAKENAGAIYGEPMGLHGKSYAIVTKDLRKDTHPSVDISDIVFQIGTLYYAAEIMPTREFIIVYKNRPNRNGYTPKEMAHMFLEAAITGTKGIPDNILFDEEFAELIKSIENEKTQPKDTKISDEVEES